MRRTLTIAMLACASASVAAGQVTERASESGQPQRGAARGQGANRAGLELQLRQKLARRARMELGLNQDQMVKLAEVNNRFGQQQRALDQRENQTRQSLRQTLMEAPSADQDRRVGDLHEQLMQLQRQRLDLIAGEQKELGGFMTNVQRVRFQGLQENFRRQLQDGVGPPGGPPGSRRGPPPR
jgi:hypothetical protein